MGKLLKCSGEAQARQPNVCLKQKNGQLAFFFRLAINPENDYKSGLLHHLHADA
jgi:hypothetical protein